MDDDFPDLEYPEYACLYVCDDDPTVRYGIPPEGAIVLESDGPTELSDSEPDPEIPINDVEVHPGTRSFVKCSVLQLKTLLAEMTQYHGNQNLSNYVLGHKGCIILPLHAIGLIRNPSATHRKNPPAMLYIDELNENEDFDMTLKEIIDAL